MYFSALAELEESHNITHCVNPFNLSSDSDSYESFTDSSFDSCNSELSDGSFHSDDDGPPTKPLPQPPERKKKVGFTYISRLVAKWYGK